VNIIIGGGMFFQKYLLFEARRSPQSGNRDTCQSPFAAWEIRGRAKKLSGGMEIFMKCRIADLRCKEVINICTGFRMGFVSDVLINVTNGCVVAIVVPGPCKFFGLFGRDGDYVIPWDCIKKFGDDIILVEVDKNACLERRGKKKWI
jgi:YlmC/YmxH family sporulation protein